MSVWLSTILFLSTFPHGRISMHKYSLYITTSACERAWGADGTPDKPWELIPGHTWAQCFDSIVEISQDGSQQFFSDMALDDFMHGIPGMMLVVDDRPDPTPILRPGGRGE